MQRRSTTTVARCTTFTSVSEHFALLNAAKHPLLVTKNDLRATALMDRYAYKPIIKHLVAIIDREYTERPETKAIIFVEHREATGFLAEFLSRRSELSAHFEAHSVQALTSTNQSTATGGMSVSHQQQVLRSFASGLSP